MTKRPDEQRAIITATKGAHGTEVVIHGTAHEITVALSQIASSLKRGGLPMQAMFAAAATGASLLDVALASGQLAEAKGAADGMMPEGGTERQHGGN